jgi:hypothetical protein
MPYITTHHTSYDPTPTPQIVCLSPRDEIWDTADLAVFVSLGVFLDGNSEIYGISATRACMLM